MAVDPTTGRRLPRILVVEDDQDLRRMIKTMLTGVGEVTTANDGVEAMTLLDGLLDPDVIVTDLMMPRMDGLQLVKEIRANPKIANIPVIVLTAKGTPMDVISGINAGARHYLTKPFKASELVDKVTKSLRKR
jgi:DNA-binding response OmpR family regulator